MGAYKPSLEMRDLLFFFPIKLNTFINYIVSSLEEESLRGIGVLMILSKNGPTPISHIGEVIAVQKPNMTPIIDELVEKGLAKRCISKEDRRIINVELTEEGAAYLENMLQKIDNIIGEKSSTLSDNELDSCIDAIRCLTKTFNKIMSEQK